jgi:hypothetical protein
MGGQCSDCTTLAFRDVRNKGDTRHATESVEGGKTCRCNPGGGAAQD